MSAPWFDPNGYAWIPGTLFGCAAGVWGTLTGIFAPMGKARALIFGGAWVLLALSAVLLVASVIALAYGQPYGVWYGLGLPGLLGMIILPVNLPNLGRVYRAAEERRMQARDMPL
jgi:hypothetical protein